ncbi:hypothetical protein [Salinivibrio proteolyticus]|uniref:Glycosyltransferase n=1 Tax=Salinivibrio proteolyticus TaxID=334715 RepID=A0ABY7LA77_9GAMM|nr:hypothetical protein [Salinivibrio proteolyticus]WBA13978.1 hypothetical protein N7E60_09590 [Salinivibrio proteolyticus]
MLSQEQCLSINKTISESCVLVVQSCDAYEDVWDMFFSALSENWPGCTLDIILNTETKVKTFGSLKLNTENVNRTLSQPHWGQRLLNVLNHVEKDYIITLFDDFILEDKVNILKIKQCIELMEENRRLGVFYFNNIPNTHIASYDGFFRIGKTTDYKVNSSPALWRKTVLQEMTGEIDNAWAWEFFGSARAYGDKYEFHCAIPSQEDVFVYQYDLGGAIRRGKWVEKVVSPAVKKYDLSLDPELRGYANAFSREDKYSFKWKVNFVLLGLRMVGVKAFVPLIRAVYTKIRVRLC